MKIFTIKQIRQFQRLQMQTDPETQSLDNIRQELDEPSLQSQTYEQMNNRRISEETQKLKKALQQNYLREKSISNYENLNIKDDYILTVESRGIEHLNPAKFKINKNKGRYIEQQYSRLSQRVPLPSMRSPTNSIEGNSNFLPGPRLSLPTSIMNKNVLKPIKRINYQKMHNETPPKRKMPSIQKNITCPYCLTKISKLILNSHNKQPRSPRILMQGSPSKQRQNKLVKSSVQNLEESISVEIKAFQKYIAQFETKVSEKLSRYHNLITQHQQSILSLEMKSQRYKNLISKLNSQNEKLHQMLVGGTTKGNSLQSSIKTQNRDSIFQGRMQSFQSRTQYTENFLLNSETKKSQLKNQNGISHERTKQKYSNEKQSIVAEQLDNLEKLVESHLTFNF